MSKPYTGGCACGAIRYEIPGEPLVTADCQCRDCQHRSGAVRGHAWDHLDPAVRKFDRMPPR